MRRDSCSVENTQQCHHRPPLNVGLAELVRVKRECDWKPSLSELRQGFRGWHQRGYLPHFDAPGVTQFVTFQLADAFPVRRCPEWEPILGEPDGSVRRRKLEAWLDRGRGECWLGRPEFAELVEGTLGQADGRDYRLQSWVIMPNHVHLVIDVWNVPLARLINHWKGKSSRLANGRLNRRGTFWHADYFDTLIRDEAHLKRSIRYVEQNPVKAFLVKTAQEWPWSSARHRDAYERLPWQVFSGSPGCGQGQCFEA